jgi:hypothetical protein
MVMVTVPEIVPFTQLGMVGVFVAACILGPVLGGAIVDGGSWRWIFLLKYAYPLQEGGSHFAWVSGPILATIFISVLSWIAFAIWEHLLAK